FTGSLTGGIVNLNGTNNLLSVASGNTVTFTGQVFGTGNLTKQAAGALVLSNQFDAASTFSGQTTITGGILNVQSGTALGSSTNVIVANTGAALQLQALPSIGLFAMGRPLFLNGTGVGGNGALENVFGGNTF